jgi:hypothetical protein
MFICLTFKKRKKDEVEGGFWKKVSEFEFRIINSIQLWKLHPIFFMTPTSGWMVFKY